MADWKTVTENDNYKVNEFGEIFSSLNRSVSECARKEGVTSGAITQHLTGKVKKKRFEYLYKGVE